MDVILLYDVKLSKGLLNDVLEDSGREINLKGTLVDSDCAVAFFEDYASDSCFTATYCINCFHCLRLFKVIDVENYGVLGLVGMVGTVVYVHVLDDAASETVLGEHALHHMDEQGVHTGLEVLVE